MPKKFTSRKSSFSRLTYSRSDAKNTNDKNPHVKIKTSKKIKETKSKNAYKQKNMQCVTEFKPNKKIDLPLIRASQKLSLKKKLTYPKKRGNQNSSPRKN